MTSSQAPSPVGPGERAPDFTLPAVHREGTVCLADYRGKSPLLLAIFRGLYCPFCRRAIAAFGAASDRLRAAGVETLAVVATSAENARLYFKLRPARVPLAADPGCVTHRAYRLPQIPWTPTAVEQLRALKVNPTGELPEPMSIFEGSAALDRIDRYQPTDADARDERHWLQGQFLVDRDGVIRWANVECATEGLAGIGKFPIADELLAAARVIA